MRQLVLALTLVASACGNNPGNGGSGGGSTASGGGTAATGGGTASTGGGSSSGGGSASTGGGTAATGGGAVDRDAGFCNPAATYGGGEVGAVPGAVTATIVDQLGAPVASQPIYLCGLDICSDPKTTDAQGNASISTTLSEKRAAFKFGDTLAYAEFAIPVATSMMALGTITTAKFPTNGGTLTPGASTSSGNVTVTLAANTDVEIDQIVYETAQQQEFRAVEIPIVAATPLLGSVQVGGQSAGFGVLYAVSPAETTFCPAAKVSVPNDVHWAANAAVEFWITTTDTGQTYAPYAGWAKVSDGAVSSDGATISTAVGQGLPLLEHFAIRLK